MSSSNDAAQSGLAWYVIRTRSGTEAATVERLKWRGYRDLYLPLERRLRRTAKGTQVVDRALIPGLMFLGIGPDSPALYGVVAVPGVIELVRNSRGEAAAIRRHSDGYHPVYDIQARQARGEFDHTPKAKAWRKGDRVRIEAGCFSGQIGEVLKAEPGDRARVLLKGLFGGASGVPVDPRHLTAVETAIAA